jgi:quinol monooxygenase YgiN
MNKILKYILFRTVLVIITLHTIIPHPHSDELTEEEHSELHKNSNSLFGIIRLAFHESGDESLDNLIYTQYESVNKVDSKHTYPKVSLFNNIQSIVEKRETKKTVKSSTNNFNRLLFVKLNGLRGPPVLT